jgi:hypothetical protein
MIFLDITGIKKAVKNKQITFYVDKGTIYCKDNFSLEVVAVGTEDSHE